MSDEIETKLSAARTRLILDRPFLGALGLRLARPGIGGGDSIAPDALFAFNADGAPVEGFPIVLDGPARSTPVICDLDRDGDVDIVHGSWGRLMHVWDMPFVYDRHQVPWPTYRGNVQRDGVLFPLELVSAPNDLPATFTVESPFPNPFNPTTTIS